MIRDDYNWFKQAQPFRHASGRTGEALVIYTGRVRFWKVLLVVLAVFAIGGTLLCWHA